MTVPVIREDSDHSLVVGILPAGGVPEVVVGGSAGVAAVFV